MLDMFLAFKRWHSVVRRHPLKTVKVLRLCDEHLGKRGENAKKQEGGLEKGE